MQGSIALLAATKALTLLFGSLLAALSFRAYRRTGSPALFAITLGIGLLTAGAILGGLLHQLWGYPLASSLTVQSVFTAVGFGVLIYALYTTTPSTGRRTRGAD